MLYSLKIYHNAMKLTEYVNNRDINEFTKQKRLNKIKLARQMNNGLGKYTFKTLNSLTRSKQKLFDYAMENNFEYFFTGTFNKNRTDYKTMVRSITQMIRDLRKINKNVKGPEIKYILIPELHSDGINWHLHGLISRYIR